MNQEPQNFEEQSRIARESTKRLKRRMIVVLVCLLAFTVIAVPLISFLDRVEAKEKEQEIETRKESTIIFYEADWELDIMKDPGAAQALKPLTDALSAVFRPNADEDSPAAEAISNEMTAAMLNYMPLRGMLSFGGDQLPKGFLEQILAGLNSSGE
jgi:hypothetical protein